MSDRSDELRRQRDLLREHLAWIEREIAAESQRSETAPILEAPKEEAPVFERPLDVPPPPVDDREAEEILSEYRAQGASLAKQTRRGCLLYFVLAMGLLIAALFAFYLVTRARHAH